MNISLAVIFWMIGDRLQMGPEYYICIIIFTFLHFISCLGGNKNG
jgi:hypothetical protein